MKVEQIADKWGVHYNTVYKLIRSGKIKALPRANKRMELVVPEEEVARFEQERCIPEDEIGFEEAMYMLGVTRYMLNKLVNTGRIKAYRYIDRGRMYFSESDVKRLAGQPKATVTYKRY